MTGERQKSKVKPRRRYIWSVGSKSRTDLGGVFVSVFGEGKRWDGVEEIETPDEEEAEDEGFGKLAGAVQVDDRWSDPAKSLKMKRAEKECRPNVRRAQPNPDAHHETTPAFIQENL